MKRIAILMILILVIFHCKAQESTSSDPYFSYNDSTMMLKGIFTPAIDGIIPQIMNVEFSQPFFEDDSVLIVGYKDIKPKYLHIRKLDSMYCELVWDFMSEGLEYPIAGAKIVFEYSDNTRFGMYSVITQNIEIPSITKYNRAKSEENKDIILDYFDYLYIKKRFENKLGLFAKFPLNKINEKE